MSSNLKAAFLFVFCFGFGLTAFYSVSKNSAAPRDPAAIGSKVFQITSLSSEQIRDHLVQKIKVFPTMEGKKAIQFSGFSSALCKLYPEVEMQFQAEGVAVAGEAPVMKITSPCEIGQDPAEMASIQLPIEKILAEKPRNAEFVFDGFSAKVSFTNSADEWPRQWTLKSVQFKDASGNYKSASFERKVASENRSERPVVLEF